jgi:Concanavalin A-like lectin/glucanases superfamily
MGGMGRALAVVAVLAGCGRGRFDPLADAAKPTGFALRVDGTGYAMFDSVCGSMTGPITIAGWVNPDSAQADPSSCMFCLNSADGGTNYALVMWDLMGTKVGYFDDFFTNRLDNLVASAPGSWHFTALVIDAAGAGVIYQDGTSDVTFDTSRTVAAPCRFSLGQEWDGTTASDFFSGYFDEVSVWSVAKTTADVQALMTTKPAPGDDGLVAYYTFDAGDARDDSGNQHDGQLAGTAAIVPTP